ncbi:MAG: hypothetical protein QGH39_02065 [Candidatus Thermoplasmatota archaeon]|nr:hypothetical protein [Candidatus Thermoplasmatota archaeon]
MTSSIINSARTIILYDDITSGNLVLSEIKKYLSELIPGIRVELRSGFIEHFGVREKIPEFARKLARIKLRDQKRKLEDFNPLPGEIQFEKKLLDDPKTRRIGVIYDGFEFQKFSREMIPENELEMSVLHIFITNRLIATFDDNDRRYHARVIITGYPAVISTSGIVEAPAKPRDFYRMKQMGIILGDTTVPAELLNQHFQGRFMEHNDERLTEVIKGYILQAVFYHTTGEAFCNNTNCRLFNSHWQKEMIKAQIESGKLCKDHTGILNELIMSFEGDPGRHTFNPSP